MTSALVGKSSDVGGRCDDGDSLRDRDSGHLPAFVERARSVVEAGENVRVEIDHGRTED